MREPRRHDLTRQSGTGTRPPAPSSLTSQAESRTPVSFMSRASNPVTPAGLFRRLMALGCAGLVFALTVFAASPTAHAWLHASAKHAGCTDHAHKPVPVAADTHDCAVVLFASGVSLPVGPVAITPPLAVVRGELRVTAAAFYLVSPRYLRHPERGPPAIWAS